MCLCGFGRLLSYILQVSTNFRYAPNARLRSRNLLHNVGTSGQILPPDVCYDTMYTSSSRIHHLKADHQARSIQMTQGMT
uniref:Secreted protein n=1 Tax=Bursaphelenchus xylophilus TaxID=6326 RepID=A0A1I7SGC7_BURXY